MDLVWALEAVDFDLCSVRFPDSTNKVDEDLYKQDRKGARERYWDVINTIAYVGEVESDFIVLDFHGLAKYVLGKSTQKQRATIRELGALDGLAAVYGSFDYPQGLFNVPIAESVIEVSM